MTSTDFEVGRATAAELAELAGIEARAARLFPPEDLPAELADQTIPAEELARAQQEQRLFVARETTSARVVGFALLSEAGRDALLEEVDVDPEFGRRGLGGRLVAAVCDAAREAGHARIVLSTFRHLAWNADFYARLGFRELAESEWTAAQRTLRREEAALGLDPTRRVWMARELVRG